MTAAILLAAALCLLPAVARAADPPYPAPGMGHPGDGPAACVIAPRCVMYDDPRHHGCGSRGGPGCRKDNGHCAAWRDGFAPDCRVHPRTQ